MVIPPSSAIRTFCTYECVLSYEHLLTLEHTGTFYETLHRFQMSCTFAWARMTPAFVLRVHGMLHWHYPSKYRISDLQWILRGLRLKKICHRSIMYTHGSFRPPQKIRLMVQSWHGVIRWETSMMMSAVQRKRFLLHPVRTSRFSWISLWDRVIGMRSGVKSRRCGIF